MATTDEGYSVIDDSTPMDDFHDQTKGTGLLLAQRSTPYGQMKYAPPFPPELEIPESEWQARIEEKVSLKNRISDHLDRVNSPCKDQQQTNFCWANAPTRTLEINRILANLPQVILSPASVACPINGFKNQGGIGEEALSYLIEHGAVPVDSWPANAISRTYATPNADALRALYKFNGEWMELVPRNHKQIISCLLRDMPVAVGLNWWSHEITYIDAVWLDGQAVPLFENSWGMSYGTKGRNVLQGQRMLADDAVCARVPVAA